MGNWIYQLRITLIESRPRIWRRILVEEDILLSDLHKIIQTTMGWTNSHMSMISGMAGCMKYYWRSFLNQIQVLNTRSALMAP